MDVLVLFVSNPGIFQILLYVPSWGSMWTLIWFFSLALGDVFLYDTILVEDLQSLEKTNILFGKIHDSFPMIVIDTYYVTNFIVISHLHCSLHEDVSQNQQEQTPDYFFLSIQSVSFLLS